MILFNSRTSERLVTQLTEREAYEALAGAIDEFAFSIKAAYDAGTLTEAQRFWLFKRAEEVVNPAPRRSENIGGDFSRITTMFARAGKSLKRPKIHLCDNEGNDMALSLAPASGRNAGYIYVKVGAEYAGKIAPSGVLYPMASCPATVVPYLREFAKNPEEIATRYGKLKGCCCFCAKSLTDARSTSVGYGPICAEKFGLAWGEVSADPMQLTLLDLPAVQITARTRPRPQMAA